MRHLKNTVVLVCITLATLAGVQRALAATVTVFAAVSLKEVLDEQARRFQAATGDRIVAVYAASNALARQIEAGAPADVFISADLDWMNHVEQRKMLVAGSRIDLIANRLVLVAPAASRSSLRIAPGFALGAELGNGRLAIANPDSVPAGKYAKAALEKLGVWTAVKDRVARAENVRAALALVARNEAPFGIVYKTDAISDKAVRIVDTFPADSHPPIIYPAALIASGKADVARSFLAYLATPAAATVWMRHGFQPAH